MTSQGFQALDHAGFLAHAGGRLHQEGTAGIPLFQPDPFVVAGAAARGTGYDIYRGMTCNLPPPGVLELQDVIVTGYGLVAAGDALLVDARYTTSSNELGTELFQHFAPLGPGRFGGVDIPAAPEAFDDAVLLTRRGDAVYGHWLLEVLPKVPLVMPFCRDGTVFLVSKDIRPYQVDFLVRLGINPGKIIRTDAGRSYRCNRLLVPALAHPNDGTLHPFSVRAYDALRSWALRAADAPSVPKLFLTRRSRTDDPRQLWNLDQMEEVARRRGYLVVDPGTEPVSTQINLLAHAERIVGLAGSGLHNTVFTGSDASVLVIQPSHFLNRLQTAIAGVRGHRVGYLIGEAFSAFDKASWSGCFIADPDLLGYIDEYVF